SAKHERSAPRQLSRLLELAERIVEPADLLEGEAEADARLQEGGTELQRPLAPRDRPGIVARIIVHPGLGGLQDRRERVEAARAAHALEGLRRPSRLGEHERARVVALREPGIELYRPPKLVIGFLSVPLEEEATEA